MYRRQLQARIANPGVPPEFELPLPPRGINAQYIQPAEEDQNLGVEVLQVFENVFVNVVLETEKNLGVAWYTFRMRELGCNGKYHAKGSVPVEFEFVVAAGYLDDIGYLENGLESDALLPDVSPLIGGGKSLGTFPDFR